MTPVTIGKRQWRHFIGGSWCDSDDQRELELLDPATGRQLARIACAGAAEVERAVAAARAAFDSWWRRPPVERAALVHAVGEALLARVEEIATVECLDSGKRLSEARETVRGAARYFSYYAGVADKLEGRSIPLGPGYVDYTVREPYGVTAHVVPWNYPINLAARSVACALAAGNTAVIKSPELAPLSICCLAEACERAGIPPGVVNVICGIGAEAGAALVAHEGVDQIIFTGSVATGQAILAAAARRIVPCVVELGGKSAGVVFADADLDGVVRSTVGGSFANAGQICSAQSRLVVHRSVQLQVQERLLAALATLTSGPGIEDHDLTPLISAGQREAVEAFCRAAERAGAKMLVGGRPAAGDGFFFEPTVVTEVAPTADIAQQEVFGPLLCVLPFDEPEEAIAIANGTRFGLAAGVYTADLSVAHWAAERLAAGQVFVNEWFAGGVETPFGGIKASGFGREKGQEALNNYLRTKNVAVRLETIDDSGQ